MPMELQACLGYQASRIRNVSKRFASRVKVGMRAPVPARKPLRFGFHIVSMSAADDNGEDLSDVPTLDFEAKLGQNIRQGLEGWNTRMTVQKAEGADSSQVAEQGDEVTVSYVCQTTQGDTVMSSEETGEPLSFEVGTRDFMGNPFFQGIDEAVRGLSVGQEATMQASGGEYNPELLFTVPRDHPEMQRLALETVDKGGMQEGTAVVLANGAAAVVVKMTDENVTVDANHPLAGAPLVLVIQVQSIIKNSRENDAKELGV